MCSIMCFDEGHDISTKTLIKNWLELLRHSTYLQNFFTTKKTNIFIIFGGQVKFLWLKEFLNSDNISGHATTH